MTELILGKMPCITVQLVWYAFLDIANSLGKASSEISIGKAKPGDEYR
jgi:hypothetical protein